MAIKEDEEQERISLYMPSSITHCIEWALHLFEEYYVKITRDLKLFC